MKKFFTAPLSGDEKKIDELNFINHWFYFDNLIIDDGQVPATFNALIFNYGRY